MSKSKGNADRGDGDPFLAFISDEIAARAARAAVPTLARQAREIEIIAKRVMRDGTGAPEAYVDLVQRWHVELLRLAAGRGQVKPKNARWLALDAAIDEALDAAIKDELVPRHGRDVKLARFPAEDDGLALLQRLLLAASKATSDASFDGIDVAARRQAVEVLVRTYRGSGGRQRGLSATRGTLGKALLVGVVEALARRTCGAELHIESLRIAAEAAPTLRHA